MLPPPKKELVYFVEGATHYAGQFCRHNNTPALIGDSNRTHACFGNKFCFEFDAHVDFEQMVFSMRIVESVSYRNQQCPLHSICRVWWGGQQRKSGPTAASAAVVTILSSGGKLMEAILVAYCASMPSPFVLSHLALNPSPVIERALSSIFSQCAQQKATESLLQQVTIVSQFSSFPQLR